MRERLLIDLIRCGLKVFPQQEDAHYLELEGGNFAKLRFDFIPIKVFPPIHSFLTWPIIDAKKK